MPMTGREVKNLINRVADLGNDAGAHPNLYWCRETET